MKINFKQPKYIIPLIILPFLILGFFIFGGRVNTNQNVITNNKVEGLNTNMPGVDTSISKGQIKDKFSAYQQAFKNVTDQSAMADMDKPAEGVQGIDYTSSYSSADKERLEAQRKMDSLNQVLHIGQTKIQDKITQYNRSRGFGESGETTRRNSGGYLPDNGESGDSLLNKLLKMQQQDSRQQQSRV